MFKNKSTIVILGGATLCDVHPDFLLKVDYLNHCRVHNDAKFLTPFWKARGQNYDKAESTRDKAAISATIIQDDTRIETKESLTSLQCIAQHNIFL